MCLAGLLMVNLNSNLSIVNTGHIYSFKAFLFFLDVSNCQLIFNLFSLTQKLRISNSKTLKYLMQNYLLKKNLLTSTTFQTQERSKH